MWLKFKDKGQHGMGGTREVDRSKTPVGHGEESGLYSGNDRPERALEPERALGCLQNPCECWNAPGPSPTWGLSEKCLKHGNSHVRPRMWPGHHPVPCNNLNHGGTEWGAEAGEVTDNGGDFHNFLHTPRIRQTSDKGTNVGKERTL